MRTTTLFFHPTLENQSKVSRITFSISPERDEKGTLIRLLVGTAVCKVPDVFSKREGRLLALAKEPVECSLHSLPKYVAQVMNAYDKGVYYHHNNYAWLSLRFV